MAHPSNCNCLIHLNGKLRFTRSKGNCKHCNGTGARRPRVHLVKCKYCDGTGKAVRLSRNVLCPECGRDLPLVNGKIVRHGPGKNSLFCSGSGMKLTEKKDGTPDTSKKTD